MQTVSTRILLPLLLSLLGLIAPAEAQTSARLFGPKTYTRTAGPPNQFTERFCATTPSGRVTLIVENGKDGENRLSSATITLNGETVLQPRDLNQQVARVERAITLQPENRLDIELRSGPGGFLTLRLECVGCLEVKIDSPTAGSGINQPSTLVSGTIQTTAPEVGVTVNGVLAQMNGTRFVAPEVPLQIGANTLTATATDFCGAVATDAITVQTTAIPEPQVFLTASPSSGLSPLATTLSIASLMPGPLARVEVDFEGDGVVDHTASTLADLPHTYTTERFYFPTVTLTDTSGTRVTATTIVNVFPLPNLPVKWEGMKGALVRGDLDAALRFIVASARPRYREAFTVLASDLPAINSILTDLTFVELREGRAEFKMLRVEQGVPIAYFILFVQDADGLWRLKFF